MNRNAPGAGLLDLTLFLASACNDSDRIGTADALSNLFALVRGAKV
jgi:hypothetical protein